MSTITYSNLTLSEQIKQIGPDGMTMDVVNTLIEENEILKDAVFEEANEGFSNLGVKVLELPTIGARRINDGASGGVVKSERHREVVQILEARPGYDKLLLDSQNNPQTARKNQVMGFVEAMAQAQADAIIYGNNDTDADEIDGLTTRYNLSTLSNVTKAGGSGSDTTSLWMVEWRPDRCKMIYPRGASSCGIVHEDKGEQVLTNSTSGKRYDGYEDMLRVSFGLDILDDDCIQRLVNIESAADAESGAIMSSGVMNLLIAAKNRLPKKGKNAVIYCNVDILTQFEILADNRLLGCWRTQDVFGDAVLMYKNMPIRVVEAILSTETALA